MSSAPRHHRPYYHKSPNRSRSHPSQPQPRQQSSANPPSEPQLSIYQLREKAAKLERENYNLQKSLQYERSQAEKQNCPRDVQLEGLKEYLDTHDKSGFAEISAKLDLVNDLVDQLASDVSGQFQSPVTTKPSNSTIARDSQSLRAALGWRLAHILDVCDPSDPNVAVIYQYAIQTSALYESWKLCDVHFSRRVSGPERHIFYNISRSVQHHEIQPIYGRWRALAHHHLRVIETPEAQEKNTDAFVSRASSMFTDIYAAILGVSSPEEKVALANPVVEPSLRELYKHATQLSIMVKEEVVSTDFILFAPQAGVQFDAKRMEFPYEPSEDSQPQKEDTVICTVKLGLNTWGKRGREQEEAKETHKKKAQVFTEEVLELILGPFEPPERPST